MTEQDRPAFLQAFNRLAVALKEAQDETGVTLRVYFDALADLEIEFVVAAVPVLLREAWFPKTGEWWRTAHTIRLERVRAQRERMLQSPTPWCDACGDSGWKPVRLVRRGQPISGVERCACVAQRYQELLGHAEMPALSPGPVEPPTARQIAELQAAVTRLTREKTL